MEPWSNLTIKQKPTCSCLLPSSCLGLAATLANGFLGPGEWQGICGAV